MRLFLFLCLVSLFITVSVANDEEFSTFFNYLSTFNSYYPYRVPPIPSISLPTIYIADTDDSSAPFGFVTFSREGAIPTFILPPASYFRTTLFGNGVDDDGFIVESSDPANDESISSSLYVSFMLVVSMIIVSIL